MSSQPKALQKDCINNLRRLRFKSAEKIADELTKIDENHVREFCSNVYRDCGALAKSLDCNKKLAKQHDSPWQYIGKLREAQDLIALGLIGKNGLKDFFEPEMLTPAFNKKLFLLQESLKSAASYTDKTAVWLESYSNTFTSKQAYNSFERFIAIQYWSQALQPKEVDLITNAWNSLLEGSNCGKIQRFDKQSARSFISKHQPQLLKAFDTAFHYAIEADIFRIAFALSYNCIWIDSDAFPTSKTKSIIERGITSASATLLLRWHKPWITNAFFITPKGNSLFVELAKRREEYSFEDKKQTRDEVFNSFGPGHYNATVETMTSWKSSDLDKFRLQFVNDYNGIKLHPYTRLNYKKTNQSWQVALQ